ncbi:hypothetical protein DP939_23175 [Spongiactinospora rosea]|uniref:Uncharacterized protein n=1 Tax=Spongiactinospora rosea TaxID=2248750 RepID=A0A366LW06_9ACTN|nr:hypothetical protein [Spongiactinospora rosea]RBQ17770.1 hypothetical protein DP939_23175 [Spongiactinospora rosea]
MAVGILAAVIVWWGLGLEWWWAAAAWATCLVLGSMCGRAVSKLVIDRMEFTRTQVSLTSSTSSTTVDINTVIDIEISHWVETAEHGLTTLSMSYGHPGVVKTVSVTNLHDPTLAGRLAQLLGPQVLIQETTTKQVKDP